MSFKNASEYVISFISKYGDNELLNKWNNNDFKKLFKEKKTKVDGPKKNKSSYLFFCDDERQVIKKQNLGLSNKEIISELANRWGLIKENPKMIEKYTLLAKEDKERYDSEVRNHIPTENTDVKIKKEKSDIKKNKSSYLFFCDEERLKIKKENLDLSNKEIISELANRWKNIKDDPKKIEKFVKLAESDKNRYENEKNLRKSDIKTDEIVVEDKEDVIVDTEDIIEKPKKNTKKSCKKVIIK
jgi:hypothetical protein